VLAMVAILTSEEPGFFPLSAGIPAPEPLVCSHVPISPADRRVRSNITEEAAQTWESSAVQVDWLHGKPPFLP
jgi:hypothetical protein